MVSLPRWFVISDIYSGSSRTALWQLAKSCLVSKRLVGCRLPHLISTKNRDYDARAILGWPLELGCCDHHTSRSEALDPIAVWNWPNSYGGLYSSIPCDSMEFSCPMISCLGHSMHLIFSHSEGGMPYPSTLSIGRSEPGVSCHSRGYRFSGLVFLLHTTALYMECQHHNPTCMTCNLQFILSTTRLSLGILMAIQMCTLKLHCAPKALHVN